MLQNSTNSIQNHQQWSECKLQRLLSITTFCDVAYCSQHILGNTANNAAVWQVVPHPVQSRCCPRKAPLQRLVCCPTPARMHSPLRQKCDNHLDERLHSAIQLWCKCGTLLNGVKNDKLRYDCNAMAFVKLAWQHVVALMHCKGCAVVHNL